MISRLLQSTLAAAWTQFPVVAVSGARQAGKTTLARMFLPHASYVTLDLPAEAETARLNPESFLRSRATPLIVDEVQYAPELLRHLKIEVDRDRRPGRFLVTGSQSFHLMAGVTESLAGRCAILNLPPLTLREAPVEKGRPGLDAFLWRGSYPELWQRPELDRSLWLGSYLATYLERDVRNIVNVGSLRDFDRFLRACALRAGQILSYAELARDVGITPNTAKSWISVLEASQQILLLEPYHRQRTKRLTKTPKLYLYDTGLLTYLSGFARPEDLFRHAHWGAVWENFVVAELAKSFLVRGHRPPLWFWRTSAGDEVDVLVEHAPERFVVVEIKTAEQVDVSAVRGVRVLTREYGDESVTKTFVVCRTAKAYPLARGGSIEAVPLNGDDGLLFRPEIAGRPAFSRAE